MLSQVFQNEILHAAVLILVLQISNVYFCLLFLLPLLKSIYLSILLEIFKVILTRKLLVFYISGLQLNKTEKFLCETLN